MSSPPICIDFRSVAVVFDAQNFQAFWELTLAFCFVWKIVCVVEVKHLDGGDKILSQNLQCPQ